MALDVNKLIADAKAARVAAEAEKAAADKAAAALKASKAANRDVRLEVDNKLNYANALSQTLTDIEGKLTVYATQIGRGTKLGPGEQKEFDSLLAQYKKVDSAYKKTVNETNDILAKAPSPTTTVVKGGRVEVAPTKEEIAVTGAQPEATTPGAPKPDDFAGLLKKSTEFIKNMSGPDRKMLAQSLNDSLNLQLPVNELIDPATLLAAYNSAIAGAQARYKQFGDVISVEQYLNRKKLENSILKQAGGSGAGAGTWGQIYDPSQAKSSISSIVTSLLGREATDKEISSITKKLTKAQADNPYKKNAQGLTVGGINADQFITDIVKAMPEYTKKQEAKTALTADDIAETARLNGISLSPIELKDYADRVKAGEDIKAIQKEIRMIASNGHPDAIKQQMAAGANLNTIYSPYRNLMAASLGLDPNSITLNDPTLRMAIGPDKEMSLYDFKKAIRKDNRWKYSQEANDEVTAMVNQVKRDFGFMG